MLALTLPSLALIASILPTCASVLLPAKVSLADLAHVDAWDGIPRLMRSGSKVTTHLSCKSCPLAIGTNANGQPVRWVEGIDSKLVMEFSSHGNQLLLNGDAFYPPTPKIFTKPLSAKQIIANGNDEKTAAALFDGMLPLSTSIDLEPITKASQLSGKRLSSKVPSMRRISIEVIGLVDKLVKVDTLDVHFSERDGQLVLHGVSTIAYSEISTPTGDRCTTVLCRARAVLAGKLGAFQQLTAARYRHVKKICLHKLGFNHRHHSGQHSTAEGHRYGPKVHGSVEAVQAKTPTDASLNALRLHGHKHHHNRKCHGMPHILHVVMRFTKHIILPIFIGISVGMATSGLGMLIGQLIVYLWMRYRHGAQTYQALDQVDIFVEEGLMSPANEPPKYEDVCVKSLGEDIDTKKELLA